MQHGVLMFHQSKHKIITESEESLENDVMGTGAELSIALFPTQDQSIMGILKNLKIIPMSYGKLKGNIFQDKKKNKP